MDYAISNLVLEEFAQASKKRKKKLAKFLLKHGAAHLAAQREAENRRIDGEVEAVIRKAKRWINIPLLLRQKQVILSCLQTADDAGDREEVELLEGVLNLMDHLHDSIDPPTIATERDHEATIQAALALPLPHRIVLAKQLTDGLLVE